MNFLSNIIGQRIEKVVRHDFEDKFIINYPLGLHLVLVDNNVGLTIRLANDGESILLDRETLEDFKLMLQDEIEYGEINDLNEGDNLIQVVGQSITDIKIGRNVSPEFTGTNFEIRHPKFKGVKIITDSIVFGFEGNDVDRPLVFGEANFKNQIDWI